MRTAVLAAFVVFTAGCSRSEYRNAADRDSYAVIAERNRAPAWSLPRIDITPAPQSRMADPYDPDYPPLPPDDPAAARYMKHPGKFRGSKRWLDDGSSSSVEPPGWRNALPLDKDGILTLTPELSVELALVNSREYQFALEEVYLSALALTLNRFEFEIQWFARDTFAVTQFGSSATENNTLANNVNAGFTRNLSAGGQFLAEFANNLVLNFSNGSTTVRSDLIFQLIQPLLRRAGKQVRLEALTQAERDLLYAVRDFARFRKIFYADLTTRGNGYLGLLLQTQNVRNLEANIKSQEQNLRLHEALFAGGIVSLVQVDQVFQSYQASRFAVLQAQTSLDNDLDAFKISLGLPPDIEVRLDDSQLKPFQLASDALTGDQEEADKLLAGVRELDRPPTAAELRDKFQKYAAIIERAEKITAEIETDLAAWRKILDDPATAIDAASREREQSLYSNLARQREANRVALSDLADRARRGGDAAAFQRLARLVIAKLGELFVVQTQVRVFLIELPKVDKTEPAAVAEAFAQRLDLMNVRGRVVDRWRKITVAANGLEGDLDLILRADIATRPGSTRPFDFSSQLSSYSVGLRFDAPLNRYAERNIYRASLIDYERGRRDLMAFEDRVMQGVRRDLRQLRTDRSGFAIARLTLLAAARQLEGAREQLLLSERGSDSTTSTFNILNALDGVLAARNALVGRYVNYEQNRIQLLLDLEELQLDARGLPCNVAATASAPSRPVVDPTLPDPAKLLPAPRKVP